MVLGMLNHNNPPSAIEFSVESADALGDWLKINPVIETEEVARDGKLLVDRARRCLADMEDERKQRQAPLQAQLDGIRDEYRSPRNILEKILAELKVRLDAYVKAEETRRQEALAAARKAAQEAERLAREAEDRERAAADDAKYGVEADTATATRDADAAFREFQRREREVARSERDLDVKIGGGFGRALSTRFKEELVVVDPAAAIESMGWSGRVLAAILSDAREYRRNVGKLPEGVISQGERSI